MTFSMTKTGLKPDGCHLGTKAFKAFCLLKRNQGTCCKIFPFRVKSTSECLTFDETEVRSGVYMIFLEEEIEQLLFWKF